MKKVIEDKLKTIRKKNGLLLYETQSVKDATKSKISHTLVEQCATMIFLPNEKAAGEDYIGKLSLSNREFFIVKEELGKRQFLVKQDGFSLVCELDLSGMDDEIKVISGSEENLILMDQAIEKCGNDSKKLVARFSLFEELNMRKRIFVLFVSWFMFTGSLTTFANGMAVFDVFLAFFKICCMVKSY